jgi:branched-chain amino acid transport system permease protein
MEQQQLSTLKKDRLKSFAGWIASIIVVWVLNYYIQDMVDPYVFTVIMYAGINITLAVSLNLINGFTGQFSMGHAGFMSVGGYLSAYIFMNLPPEYVANPMISHFAFVGSLICAGLGAALIGYVVGLPSLRLRGDYLAIVTLGFGEIIRVVILNLDVIGGARGLPNIPQLSSFAWVYTVAIVTTFTIWQLIKSSQGRAFMSVREDEIAAESMGVDTTKTKVQAFVIGAFFAGVAGALFGHYLRYLNPQVFDFNKSFEIIIIVVLGGMGSITGSIFSAVFLTALKEALRDLKELTGADLRMIIYALLLIVFMLTRPNGIFGTRELPEIISSIKNKFFKKSGGKS